MIPLNYSYRNLIVRWRTTLMTASGFTLVVAALIIMLAFLNGVRAVSVVTGERNNVIVLKKGTGDEVLSELDFRTATQIEASPGILRGPSGRQMASRELFMVLSPSNVDTSETPFVQVRGVYPVALEVHPQVRITSGRPFRPHHREVIVGAAMARQLKLKAGDKLPLGRVEWDVVGIFEAGGATFESEAWGDLDQLADQFHRKGIVTTLVMRCADAEAADGLVEYLAANRSVEVDAISEIGYYQRQGEQTNVVRVGAFVIAGFMGLGAVLGITNTMFAAIGQRIKDIAVLRLLGFGRREILISFLLEALLIAAVGGACGSLLGYAINGLSLSTAVGAKIVAFAFKVDGQILATAAGFTFVMGFVGGALPALSAMRVSPLEALR